MPGIDRSRALLFITPLVASCGLVYELLAGTVASWVLGDSVAQFSTIIGGYLAAMGLGSYLSRFVERGLAARFVATELGVALAGGLGMPVLFLTAGHPGVFRVVLYALVLLLGVLVGLELPLLLRVLEGREEFRSLVSRVLTFDHAGSLLGSLVYSLWLAPALGPLRTALVFALLNAVVALVSTWILSDELSVRERSVLRGISAVTLVVLSVVLLRSQRVIDALDASTV